MKTLSEKQLCNVILFNVISKVFISIVVVSLILPKTFSPKNIIPFLIKSPKSELIIDFKIGSFDLEKEIHNVKNYLKPEANLAQIF
jgi:hypothetical protein